ncbi:dTMP kinase [Lunatimonas salinarum]|uniref:dTMP kinase n=1 Tax=Lunatimonas salinarum TaxID=1774590 RepID=UPI001AE03543|nr:hypothetical protein [Lunatimonas salinarum]
MIAFSGLDGAGKSTQIELLNDHLTKSGREVTIFWSRGGYTPGIEWMKTVLRKLKPSEIPKERGHTEQRERAFEDTKVRKVWLNLALLDLIWYYGVVLRFISLFKLVICDRYLIDTQIDFELNFPQEKVSQWWLWKILVTVALKPKHHFILTIPVAESQRRSLLKEEPFPDSPEVLELRLNRYLAFSSNNKFAQHIDCMQPLEKVADRIKSIVSA